MWLIDNLVPFIVLLGALVFFHELGHFLVGKWMGVRVLTFAIGFGPAIPGLTFRRGETEYRVNWFPLGGYVRFFGDDPSEELAPEEQAGSFHGAALWRRFLIVLAGPVFNLVLPFLVFFPMFLSQGEALPARLGQVMEGGPAHAAGLQDGDVIVEIDGARIHDWWAMERAVGGSGGRPVEIRVKRGDEIVGPLTLVPDEVVVRRIEQLGWEDRRGRIQVSLQAHAPEVAVAPGSAAESAGLQTGDRVVGLESAPMGPWGFGELARALNAMDGETVTLWVRQGLTESAAAENPWRFLQAATRVRRVTLPVRVLPDGSISGITSKELVVARVQPGTPAVDALGLLPGDRLTHIDGRPLRSWTELSQRLIADPSATFRLRFERGALAHWVAVLDGVENATVSALLGPAWRPIRLEARTSVADSRAGTLERSFALGRAGGRSAAPRYVFGAHNDIRLVAPDPIPLARPLSYALRRSVDETLEAYKITLMTVAGLFRGRIPMKELGGPLLIADLASQSMKQGWKEFLTLLVWLSINLGILNLLPIPVLDGGHLLLFTVEAIKRKPLSLRARQVASYIGLAVILLIMLTAMKNDIQRYWHAVFG